MTERTTRPADLYSRPDTEVARFAAYQCGKNAAIERMTSLRQENAKAHPDAFGTVDERDLDPFGPVDESNLDWTELNAETRRTTSRYDLTRIAEQLPPMRCEELVAALLDVGSATLNAWWIHGVEEAIREANHARF